MQLTRTGLLTCLVSTGLLVMLLLIADGRGQTEPQNPRVDLAERVQKLEERVAWLESQMGHLCAEDAALARINAEHELTIAEERLEQSERLAAHGYISSSQLQADRLAVEIARRELQLANVDSQNEREVAHLAVLNAEASLRQAEIRQEHSQRLLEKGYVSEAAAAQDEAAVLRAKKLLEAAELKLQMLTPEPAGAADGGQ